MGTAGEKRQLPVGSGVWKMSIPKEGIMSAAVSPHDRGYTGCLITEVVFPGFQWEDHSFLTKQGLEVPSKWTPDSEETINNEMHLTSGI
ncbi:hypothetical protein JB92DRAFT_3040303 [Gautieria morchelliformis]|nr:hypothetical protein JB92DRAFT_3040303 [Gautieria morchelliformis]